MNTRKNAIKWPQMISAVYDSFGSGDHKGDQLTKRIMDRVVSWLIKGKTLSPKLQAALLENIKQRTAFVVVEPVEEIRLTREQIKYAKRKNPEWFGLDLDEDLEVESAVNGSGMGTPFTPEQQTIPLPFHVLSTTIQHSFHYLSTTFPHQALELALELVEKARNQATFEAPLTPGYDPKDNERKEDEINHDGMNLATPGVHEFQDSSITPGDVSDGLHEPTDSLIHPGHEEEKVSQSSSGAGRKPTLTLWTNKSYKNKSRASGYLEWGNDKFGVIFSGFDHALGRITNKDGASDWSRFVDTNYGQIARDAERIAEGLAQKSTTSGLFAQEDSLHGSKGPVIGDTLVLLDWIDQVPVKAYIINGDHTFLAIDLRVEGNHYKGAVA